MTAGRFTLSPYSWQQLGTDLHGISVTSRLADTTRVAHPAVNFHFWLCLTLGRKAIHELADL
jgi:hypothetical protein